MTWQAISPCLAGQREDIRQRKSISAASQCTHLRATSEGACTPPCMCSSGHLEAILGHPGPPRTSGDIFTPPGGDLEILGHLENCWKHLGPLVIRVWSARYLRVGVDVAMSSHSFLLARLPPKQYQSYFIGSSSFGIVNHIEHPLHRLHLQSQLRCGHRMKNPA